MLGLVLPLASVAASVVPRTPRSDAVVQRVRPVLERDLAVLDLRLGARVFLRILKAEARLEAFLLGADGTYVLFRSYPICAFSGESGPKLRTGDRQAPEGFYFVPPSQMNPASAFHLSFDLGYPNAFDRAHHRTGSFLMVHGDCVSIGCYAMTDAVIEELWVLMQAAFEAGQPFVRVHAFPFAMTGSALDAAEDSPHRDFWDQLARGWEAFERTAVPPDVTVADGRYVVRERTRED
jgi:murein L,D-transpeptidase YafK